MDNYNWSAGWLDGWLEPTLTLLGEDWVERGGRAMAGAGGDWWCWITEKAEAGGLSDDWEECEE